MDYDRRHALDLKRAAHFVTCQLGVAYQSARSQKFSVRRDLPSDVIILYVVKLNDDVEDDVISWC